MEQNEQHAVTVENRKKISATLIDSVDSFSPVQIVLSYAGGKITVGGSGMKITSFSKNDGRFAAVGDIAYVKYIRKGAGIKGIFK